jgi:hypothetical protein
LDSNSYENDYLSPVSLWLVACEYELPGGHITEAASAGCGSHDPSDAHHCESGPILFASRIHAEVYSHFLNKHGVENSAHIKGDWRVIPLLDFNLRELARVKGGTVRCMLTFAMTMSFLGALIVASGAPKVLFTARVFPFGEDVPERIVFSFDKPMKLVLEEWAAMGLPAFDDELREFDRRDPAAISQAVERAIAQTSINNDPSFDIGACGVYSPTQERWVVALDCRVFAREGTVH